MTRTLPQRITAHAHGSLTDEAAALLITTALGGRLVDQLPLAWDGDCTAEIDWPAARSALSYLSGGERRILALADALAAGNPVDLSDALTGLDETNGRMVLRAVAHALGIRIHGR